MTIFTRVTVSQSTTYIRREKCLPSCSHYCCVFMALGRRRFRQAVLWLLLWWDTGVCQVDYGVSGSHSLGFIWLGVGLPSVSAGVYCREDVCDTRIQMVTNGKQSWKTLTTRQGTGPDGRCSVTVQRGWWLRLPGIVCLCRTARTRGCSVGWFRPSDRCTGNGAGVQ